MQHWTKQLQTMAEAGSTDLKMLEVVSTVRMMQHQKTPVKTTTGPKRQR
jgi:hypothetical protein